VSVHILHVFMQHPLIAFGELRDLPFDNLDYQRWRRWHFKL